MTEIAVFGAGFVGLCTAIALRQRGRDVVLVDQQGVGAGASHGNAGVIQCEAMVPYAMPREVAVLWRILLAQDSSVALRYPGVFKLLRPLASYFHHSAPKGVSRAALAYSKLTIDATQAHVVLAELSGAQALIRAGGYRLRFTDTSAMEKSFAHFTHMAEKYSLRMRALSAAEFHAVEPGIADTGVGAIEWSDPHHVEQPQQLLQRYFEYFQSIGGELLIGDALSLSAERAGWSFNTAHGAQSVAQVVIAAGAGSGRIAQHLGGSVPIIPKRGYHAVLSNGRKLHAPLIDAERGFVYSPQGDHMRVATGAELGAKGANANNRQLNAAVAQAARLFGTDKTPVSTWSGVRPCMPDMLPVMGPSQRHAGLWYNFGHGHQGLTLGPLAGRLLAEALTGEAPLDPALSPARFLL